MPSPFLLYLKEITSDFNQYVSNSLQSDKSYLTGWGRDPKLSEAQRKIATTFANYVKGLDPSKMFKQIIDAEGQVKIVPVEDVDILKLIKDKITEMKSELKKAIDQHNEEQKKYYYKDIKTSTGLTDLFSIFEKVLDYTYTNFESHGVLNQPTELSPLFLFRYSLLRYWSNKKNDQIIFTEYPSSWKDWFRGLTYDWKLSAQKDTYVATYLAKTNNDLETIESYALALLKIDLQIIDLNKIEGSMPVSAGGVTGFIPMTFSKTPASLTKELNALLRNIEILRRNDRSSAQSSTHTGSPLGYSRESYRVTSSAQSDPQPPISRTSSTPSVQSLPAKLDRDNPTSSHYLGASSAPSAISRPSPQERDDQDDDAVAYYSGDDGDDDEPRIRRRP